ncbi:MAG: TetR/AcrR family transcriptional regulator [Caldimicrobium sp.]
MTEDTRERILEAALKLFSEKGYLGATTKEIAMASGISEVTLFRHFQTKENLFISVLEHYSFLPKLKELSKDLLVMPLEETLKTLAKAFLQTLKSRRDLIRIMLAELPRYPEIVKESYQKTIEKIIQEISQYFEKLQRERKIKSSISSNLLARAFLGLFFSYFHAEEIKGLNFKNQSEEEIIDNYVKIFLYGILYAP